ncbi:MAG: TlpA family protein disulfide reductase [Methylomonas sp.]|jgi:thiol-disulfide isomerase/thioredoxin|uniref:TlpA family protein disulfide reductase n=1 Tax=Methylomonas sp. TaxID=418 RepID=UPI0025D859D8|nr:TlpA family protein disulfide reductase [Methylomonas sp.]MCK9606432.1 TlpA family protein disulfide reductase [Methylomonas sp.]
MAVAQLERIAPPLLVEEWLQGDAVDFAQLRGQVVLVEVFQVNCPGCFLYALPQAIDLHQRYSMHGLTVLGVATAFEDFDKNTRQNLQLLLEKGQVIGETLKALGEHGQLVNGGWQYRIPFPVAVDRLVKAELPVSELSVDNYIQHNLPALAVQSAEYRQQIRQQVFRFLQQREYRAETFDCFGLQGTPSHLLLDKQGVLRFSGFGFFPGLESNIQQLLAEPVPA